MKLEVNGVQYENFLSASATIRLDALCNEFAFEASAIQGQPLPFRGGEQCKVYVDDKLVITGYIEVVQVNYDASDHVISVLGRDKTADLLDSSLDAIDDIRTDGLTLKSLIELVIEKIGLDIKVIDNVSPKEYSPAEDIAGPEIGENAFEFIEGYAKKRQVLLTSDENGDIVINSNSGKSSELVLQNKLNSNDNNILSANFSYDTTGRYNSYKLASSLNPVALNAAGETDLASLVNQGGGVFDSEIKRPRQLVLVPDLNLSSADCLNQANWEADIRKARGLVYSAKVSGHSVNGELWQVNKLHQIVDDFVGKIEPMLLNSVKFNYDLSEGKTTQLGFVGQSAYTLFIGENKYAEVAANII